MPDTRDTRSLVDEAERAASGGDYASAERLLREAVVIQEAETGPLTPELANTLNNLGVVCEITDKQADAELFYRRAHEIATAVLASDHPFVVTSRKNLHDFYEARGRTAAAEPVPQPEPSVPPPQPERAVSPVPLPHMPPAPAESPELPLERSSRPLRLAALSVFGLVLVALIAVQPLFRSSESDDSSFAVATQSAPQSPPPAASPIEPMSTPREVATDHRSAAPGTTRPVPSARGTVVTSAQLCRVLSTGGSGDAWQCTPPDGPVTSGSVTFYTRLTSVRNTTVEHRWYRGDDLAQVVDLDVQANQGSGYRTYSRYRMSAESAGNWRIEIRTADGVLLHEERFVVR